MRVPLAAALLLTVSIAWGQNNPIVLKAARIFDGRQMHSPGVVVVSGSTILAAGAGAPIPIRDGIIPRKSSS